MDIKQLDSTLFNTEVSIKARIVSMSSPKQGLISVKLIGLSDNSGEMPAILGGVMPIDIEGAELSQQPKLITGDYLCPKASKKQIYLPYINIHKIVPYELNDTESEDDDLMMQEEDENKNFFTV